MHGPQLLHHIVVVTYGDLEPPFGSTHMSDYVQKFPHGVRVVVVCEYTQGIGDNLLTRKVGWKHILALPESGLEPTRCQY
jgi:hypothetical protein